MKIISTREFRTNMKKYFDAIDDGEEIIIQRGSKSSYKLIPIKDSDYIYNAATYNKTIMKNKKGLLTSANLQLIPKKQKGIAIHSEIVNSFTQKYPAIWEHPEVLSTIMRTSAMWVDIFISTTDECDDKYCFYDDFSSHNSFNEYGVDLISPFIDSITAKAIATIDEYPDNDIMETIPAIIEQESTEFYTRLGSICQNKPIQTRELQDFKTRTLTDEEMDEYSREEQELKATNSVIVWNQDKTKAYKITLTPEELEVYRGVSIKAKMPILHKMHDITESGEIEEYTSISIINTLAVRRLIQEEHELIKEQEEEI